MPFLTQRLANRFPMWTKVRRDPSSLGQRFLSGLGEIADDMQITNKWLSEEAWLLARRIGTSELWSIVLDTEDAYPLVVDDAGIPRYSVPSSVTGFDGLGTFTLTHVESIQELVGGVPDQIRLIDTEDYSNRIVYSAGDIYAGHPVERLLVRVTGSTDYFSPDRRGNSKRSGRHAVYIWGIDENDLPIYERVDVPIDGYYLTHNWFKKVTEVDHEGFDGTLEITLPDIPGWRPDPYRTLALTDVEGPLFLVLDHEYADTHLGFMTDKLKTGEEYLFGTEDILDNQDGIGWVCLRSVDHNPVAAVDLDVDPETARLWVVDDAGWVHIYDHDLPTFEAASESVETSETYVELRPSTSFVRLGDTSPMWTYFARMRFPIKKLVVRRVAPDGTEEWLDADRNWQLSLQEIEGRDMAQTLFDSLPHFKFFNTYDQLGQWNFYCTAYTEKDTSTYHTAVLAHELAAIASFDSGVANPTGCYFSQNGCFAILDGSTVSYFKPLSDKYYADFTNGELTVARAFDSLTVTP